MAYWNVSLLGVVSKRFWCSCRRVQVPAHHQSWWGSCWLCPLVWPTTTQ